MRPKRFVIEIPDRPIYKPGSGPAMAPITLQPDDTDTGWVIAGTVEFQGISQYIVTPVDNPAHRRPVRKERILDWVSPKAYEDFEYAQYKKVAEEEWERDNQLLVKAAAIKGRRHGMAVARERAKARKSFSGYMQLEPAELPSTSGHLSSLGESQDDLNTEFLPGRRESAKRKHSTRFPHDRESSVKRRGLTISGSLSLQQKSSPTKPGKKSYVEKTEDEGGFSNDHENAPNSIGTVPERPARFETPIFPPKRFRPNYRSGSTSGNTYISSYSSPAQSIASNTSPVNTAPKLNWTDLSPVVRDDVQGLRPATNRDALAGLSPRNVSRIHQANSSKEYPPILPLPSLLRHPFSMPMSANAQAALGRKGTSSKRGSPKRKFSSLSDRDESPNIENLEALGASIIGNAQSVRGKELAKEAGTSKLLSSRGRNVSDMNGTQKQKKKGSRSSSSRSSVALKGPTKSHSLKVSKEQSEYFVNMMMKLEDEEDEREDEREDEKKDGEEDEEVWEIHGILDDEWLPVDGTLVRHYLCEWVGDYEPTWEPEENVSAEAIKIYEMKIKRESTQGSDGAMDEYIDSKNGEVWQPKALRGFEEIVARENGNGGSDSEAFTDALTNAAALTPNENPQSGAGSSATDDEECGMFVRDPSS